MVVLCVLTRAGCGTLCRVRSRLAQGLALQTGVPPSVASEIRHKTLRRCLPTGADSLDMDDLEAQSVSNWQDIPRTANKRGRAVQLMSKHYAGDTVLTAGETKLSNVVAAWLSGVQLGFVPAEVPFFLCIDPLRAEMVVERGSFVGSCS